MVNKIDSVGCLWQTGAYSGFWKGGSVVGLRLDMHVIGVKLKQRIRICS